LSLQAYAGVLYFPQYAIGAADLKFSAADPANSPNGGNSHGSA
jgi:hypothetical protein